MNTMTVILIAAVIVLGAFSAFLYFQTAQLNQRLDQSTYGSGTCVGSGTYDSTTTTNTFTWTCPIPTGGTCTTIVTTTGTSTETGTEKISCTR